MKREPSQSDENGMPVVPNHGPTIKVIASWPKVMRRIARNVTNLRDFPISGEERDKLASEILIPRNLIEPVRARS